MKKIGILCICLMFLLTGCFNKNKNDVIKDLKNNINKLNSYKINGNMEISNDEEKFTYSIETYYLKDNYYKVVLVNQTNEHEQIILKTKEDVYVVTPELNKSFKFQSEWPDNSSQAYILNNIINDIEKDKNSELEQTDNGYIIKSKVNYPNNTELKYQKVYLNDKLDIEKVLVYNNKDLVKIKVEFNNFEKNIKLKESDFKLDNYVKENVNDTNVENKKEDNKKSDVNNQETNENNTQTNITNDNTTEQNNPNPNSNECSGNACENNKKTANIDNIIYPLYLPSNTYLTSSEKVETTMGNRVILTFGGEKNFVLIEEATIKNDNMEVVPVYGEPIMLTESIGALSQNSLTWDKGNISYYLASTELSIEEMSLIANSLGNNTLVANTK